MYQIACYYCETVAETCAYRPRENVETIYLCVACLEAINQLAHTCAPKSAIQEWFEREYVAYARPLVRHVPKPAPPQRFQEPFRHCDHRRNLVDTLFGKQTLKTGYQRLLGDPWED